jgi:hypothetical protein
MDEKQYAELRARVAADIYVKTVVKAKDIGTGLSGGRYDEENIPGDLAYYAERSVARADALIAALRAAG